MTLDLSGKTVLLIAPKFFGYSEEIERSLVVQGARVFHYENRPSTTVYGKAMVRLAPQLLAPYSNRYFFEIFNRHREDSIDYLFVIRGEALTPKAMEMFSRTFPAARKILYLWDSFRNDPLAPSRIEHFHIASSFDPDDANKDERLRFVPLFYLRQFAELRGHPIKHDLCFIGTVHSDRYRILRALRSALGEEYRFFYFLYLQSTSIYRVRRLLSPSFWPSKKSEFSFHPLSRKDVLDAFGASKAIVDIERSIQSGLTMRSLETLGAQRKLLTTNAKIANYDFFDERNIAIIGRKRPVIPSDFLNTPFSPTPPAILEKYSIDSWLPIVFGVKPAPSYLK